MIKIVITIVPTINKVCRHNLQRQGNSEISQDKAEQRGENMSGRGPEHVGSGKDRDERVTSVGVRECQADGRENVRLRNVRVLGTGLCVC